MDDTPAVGLLDSRDRMFRIQTKVWIDPALWFYLRELSWRRRAEFVAEATQMYVVPDTLRWLAVVRPAALALLVIVGASDMRARVLVEMPEGQERHAHLVTCEALDGARLAFRRGWAWFPRWVFNNRFEHLTPPMLTDEDEFWLERNRPVLGKLRDVFLADGWLPADVAIACLGPVLGRLPAVALSADRLRADAVARRLASDAVAAELNRAQLIALHIVNGNVRQVAKGAEEVMVEPSTRSLLSGIPLLIDAKGNLIARTGRK